MSTAPKPRPSPGRRVAEGARAVAGLTVSAAFVGGAIVGPALAESAASRAMVEALGGQATVHVDAGGLRMSNVAMQRSGLQLRAEELTIHPTADGIAIHVKHPEIVPLPSPTGPAQAAAEDPDAPSPRRAPRVPDTFGIPVTVSVDGELSVTRLHATATLVDPVAQLDGRGGASLLGELRLALPGDASIQTTGSARATATEDGWLAEATVSIDGGPDLHARATLGDALRLSITDREGGGFLATRDGDIVTVTLQDFALGSLGSLPARLASAAGVAWSEVSATGTVVLERDGDDVRAQLNPLTIAGLTIDHRALSRDPVRFEAITVSGDVAHDGLQTTLNGVLTHGDAQAYVAARLSDPRVELDVTIAPLPCQALLDSLPEGFGAALAGAQLAGEIEGQVRIVVDRSALALARAAGVLDREHPPGTLDLEFPFLERCEVLADPPGVDLDGLAGPYRHRFLSAAGVEHTRVMAPGADGFVSLRDGARLADAFVSLEDYRFFHHDGFDREQIRFAFWHNLVAGKVSRGASTISQQATRNLWLGIDRSISRKLQEAFLTARLEAQLDKDRILELYINVIELGPDVHGVEEAAQLYFGKSARALSPVQTVHIAMLAPAPRRYAARFVAGEPDEAWMETLREHLRRMRRAHQLTPAQFSEAMRGNLELLDRR